MQSRSTQGNTYASGCVPQPDSAHYQDKDVVLISHLHQDQCDLRSVRLLGDPTIIVPRGAG